MALALRRRPAEESRPFLLLALAAAPLLPVYTGRLLPALALERPVLLATAVAAVALARRLCRRDLAEPPAWALLAVAFAFYAALGTRLPGPAGPQGDEPHYLTMAESLAGDADLDLRDEFANREYAAFYAGRLHPHTSPTSPAGKLYSIHAPGLPALILPAYRLGGYAGVRLFLSALAALTGALVFGLVKAATGRVGLALAAWAALTFTPPLPFFAVAVYPETPAALATAAFLSLSQPRPARAVESLAAGLIAAFLPWLHPKLLPLAGVGLAVVLARRGSWWARAVALGMLAVSLALLLAYFHQAYGQASMSAAYGPGFASDVSLRRLPWGAAGLVFDRQFGLLSVGPIWALALPGCMRLLRANRGGAVRVILLGGASFAVGASFSMWWGGSCPPARFVVPALPCLAVALAPALGQRRDFGAALGGVGLAIVALAAESPWILHNRPGGPSGLMRSLGPDLDLGAWLPSFVLDASWAPVLALSAAAALALVWLFGTRGLLLGGLGYLLLSTGPRGAPLIDRQRAALRLIEAWDGSNVAGPHGPIALGSLATPLDLRSPPWHLQKDRILSSRPVDLPPGGYRVEVDAEVRDSPPGVAAARIELAAGDLPIEREYLRRDRPETSVWRVFLPTGARRLRAEARGIEGRVRIDAVRLVPEALVPRSLRGPFGWPALPIPAHYRAGAGPIRVTALGESVVDGPGFRVDAEPARFVVEAPAGRQVLLHLSRPRPSLGDLLEWGSRRVNLRGAGGQVAWWLDPAAGVRLGDRWLVPVRVRSLGARVVFTGGEPAPAL